MMGRPVSVTIISVVFLATGAIGVAHHASEIRGWQPFPYEDAAICLVSAVAAVCGAFLLRGSNWARWGALAWIAFHVGISFLHSVQQVVFHALLLAVIGYFLLRSQARAYFLAGRRTA